MIEDLDKYRCDNLILLVGTNPLPNLVAAVLLGREGGKIILLHSGGSRGTGKIAEYLEQVLATRRSEPVQIEKREIDESDGWSIARQLKQVLPQLKGSVGLNYTGGTKQMAVHSYRTVAEVCPDARFSYLDARTLSLLVQPRADEMFHPIREIWRQVDVTVDELLNVHGHHYKKPLSREPLLPDYADRLASLFSIRDRNSAEDFHRLICTNLEHATKLGDVNIPEYFSEAFKALGDFSTIGDLRHAVGLNAKSTARWLDGCWLEHLVMKHLKQLNAELELSDLVMNIKTITTGGNQDLKFEFDVAAVRGYQLFAISCTTSDDKGMCKDKLFEAWIRARQMGGDESHAALICYVKNPQWLEDKLNEQWFSHGHVRVFGESDIGNLKASLREWIITANSISGS